LSDKPVLEPKNTEQIELGYQKKNPLGKNYKKLLSGVSLTMLGDGLTLIAIPWIATTLTDNAFYVALVSAAKVLPWLLFSLPAGVLIDRFSHKTLMVITGVLRAIVLGILAFIVYQGWVNIPILILSTFMIGIAKEPFLLFYLLKVPIIIGIKL
jgi:MFS family permease